MASATSPKNGPSAYEKRRLRNTRLKNPKFGWFGWAMQTINWPLEKAGDLAMQVPRRMGNRKNLVGLLSLINDAAQYTVRHEAIFEDFARQDTQ